FIEDTESIIPPEGVSYKHDRRETSSVKV
ncbi:hypothetical protein Avbf_15567, partial [Armadillidium vulgare]